MARISICDLCKQPKAEVEFRLSVFKRVGKKQTEKTEADLCSPCHVRICDAVRSAPDKPLLFTQQTQQPAKIIAATIINPAVGTEQVADGIFRVPSAAPSAVKKLSKRGGPKEDDKTINGECKHNNKTFDDDTMKILCKDCGRPVEE